MNNDITSLFITLVILTYKRVLKRLFTHLHQEYLSAKSVKQRVGTLSSTDAELVAAVDCLKTITWIKELLDEINFVIINKIILYQDNKSLIILLSENSKFKRVKHMMSKLNYARQLYNDDVYTINYIPTDEMPADCLTKPLANINFVNDQALKLCVQQLPIYP